VLYSIIGDKAGDLSSSDIGTPRSSSCASPREGAGSFTPPPPPPSIAAAGAAARRAAAARGDTPIDTPTKTIPRPPAPAPASPAVELHSAPPAPAAFAFHPSPGPAAGAGSACAAPPFGATVEGSGAGILARRLAGLVALHGQGRLSDAALVAEASALLASSGRNGAGAGAGGESTAVCACPCAIQ
jgi:hypothetical protein